MWEPKLKIQLIYYCSKESESINPTKFVQNLYVIERNKSTINIWSDMEEKKEIAANTITIQQGLPILKPLVKGS